LPGRVTIEEQFAGMASEVAVVREREEMRVKLALENFVSMDEAPSQTSVFEREESKPGEPLRIGKVPERRYHLSGLPLDIFKHVFITLKPWKPDRDCNVREEGE
jgi:hypothetical protein